MRRHSSCSKLICLVIFALFLSGCGGDKLSTLDEGSTVLAFGDSLTFGVGAEQDQSYPSVLAKLSGWEVVNEGISGETTTEGLDRFSGVLAEHSPDLVILFEGGNDILRKQPLSKTKANLAQMIGISQGNDIPVVLIGVPEKALFSNSAPLYGELAEEYDLVFHGSILRELLSNPSYKSDPIHLNAAGYELLANEIYSLLGDNGAF